MRAFIHYFAEYFVYHFTASILMDSSLWMKCVFLILVTSLSRCWVQRGIF